MKKFDYVVDSLISLVEERVAFSVLNITEGSYSVCHTQNPNLNISDFLTLYLSSCFDKDRGIVSLLET